MSVCVCILFRLYSDIKVYYLKSFFRRFSVYSLLALSSSLSGIFSLSFWKSIFFPIVWRYFQFPSCISFYGHNTIEPNISQINNVFDSGTNAMYTILGSCLSAFNWMDNSRCIYCSTLVDLESSGWIQNRNSCSCLSFIFIKIHVCFFSLVLWCYMKHYYPISNNEQNIQSSTIWYMMSIVSWILAWNYGHLTPQSKPSMDFALKFTLAHSCGITHNCTRIFYLRIWILIFNTHQSMPIV